MKHRCRPIALLPALLFTTSTLALAQSYPSKPVRMIVHFPPGGPTDMVARVVAQRYSEALGQQFVIDNRPSAGGIIGVELVARAVPDGYTLLFGTGGSMAVTPATGRKLPYDVNKDFAPVSLVVINPQILVFYPGFAPNNIKELITLAKAQPGKINYASVGPGSPNHLGIELLKSMTGIDLTHIPYKGTAPAMTDVLAGQVSMLFNSMPTVIPHVKSGRLKGIAVGSAKRSSAMPNVPTVAESGVPGYENSTWNGISAPAKTPVAVVRKLNLEFNEILKMADVKEAARAEGSSIVGGPPEKFGEYLKREYAKYGKLVRDAGIKGEAGN